LFKTILLDFTGVPTIGQAFSDEIFRIFVREHPRIEVIPIHANSEVMRMIIRARSGTAALVSEAPLPETVITSTDE
ncbi:MAG: STAS-like domain-containing protein, partial [Candidatus Acidiferrales bacterium]